MSQSDADQQACEVPLVEQLRSTPKDYRTVRAIQWSEDGRETGHQFIPVGFMMHRAADEIDRLNALQSSAPASASGELLDAVRFIADCAPELNMSNYDHDQVAELNSAMCEIYSLLNAAPLPAATASSERAVALKCAEIVSQWRRQFPIFYKAEHAALEVVEDRIRAYAASLSETPASDTAKDDLLRDYQAECLRVLWGSEFDKDRFTRLNTRANDCLRANGDRAKREGGK
jgi:hypothetical protein